MFRNLSPGAVGIRADFETSLRLAAEAGFQGLDPVGDFSAYGVARTMRRQYEAAGLTPGGWGLPVEFRQDVSAFEESMRSLSRYAEAAQELGCLRCSTWVPSWSDELPYHDLWALWRDRFRAIAEVLAMFDCRLGLEFLGPKTLRVGHRYEFIHTLPEMMEMVRDVGQNVGLLLDSWHWYTAGGTVEEIRGLTDEDVVYVHVNDAPAGIPVDEQVDNVRCLPGETGVIDIAGFLGALRNIGYTGPVTAEPFVPRLAELPPEQAARETGEAMAKIWRQAKLA